MSTTPERTTKGPVITRHFESSRLQLRNLVAAFEHALPVIRRSPAQTPDTRTGGFSRGIQRRAVS
jgi:hypothetical protein